MKLIHTSLLLIVSFLLVSYDLPMGWFKAGSAIESYDMGIDKNVGVDGGNAATIKSIDTDIKGYGSLMQNCLPDKFKVSRIRFTGFVKTKDVADWAGLWLQVRQDGVDQALAFDNMFDRPIKGTTDWQKYEIVVDVPANATVISYGGIISTTGQIWLDKLKIEIVDKSVPTTGKGNEYPLPEREPSNLDFDK